MNTTKKAIAVVLVVVLVVLPITTVYAMEKKLDGKVPEWMTVDFIIAAYDARDKYGIPVSGGLIQMIIETGPNMGSSPYTPMFVEANNYGGAMYYGQPQACGTVSAYGYTFCAFDSVATWLDFQYNYQLTSSRYYDTPTVRQAIKDNDGREYVRGLCEQGYAGSPTEKVIGDYLAKYDEMSEMFPMLEFLDHLSKDAAIGYLTGTLGGGNSDAVGRAQSMIGKCTYVWGGCNAAAYQFDCSGFVAWCLTGVSSRTQENFYAHTSTYVSWPETKDPKPGDVCAYNGEQYPGGGHCGIYIGDGKMIDCTNPGGVQIRPVSSLMTFHTYPY